MKVITKLILCPSLVGKFFIYYLISLFYFFTPSLTAFFILNPIWRHNSIWTEVHNGTVWHCCPTSSAHVRTLIVYLVLARYLSHTLNIFIFFCNFPGRCPNLTRERSIPLFRLRLHAFQISCLLLWLQRDGNILVQALRSNLHTLYLSLSFLSLSLCVPLSCSLSCKP